MIDRRGLHQVRPARAGALAARDYFYGELNLGGFYLPDLEADQWVPLPLGWSSSVVNGIAFSPASSDRMTLPSRGVYRFTQVLYWMDVDQLEYVYIDWTQGPSSSSIPGGYLRSGPSGAQGGANPDVAAVNSFLWYVGSAVVVPVEVVPLYKFTSLETEVRVGRITIERIGDG